MKINFHWATQKPQGHNLKGANSS